ncbi:MAG: phospholipase D-like domain-containing protein [Oleiphilus sp.]
MTPSTQLKEIIYTDANDYFNRLIEAINIAQQSVCLEVYIFENDALSKRLIRALKQAASRNVDVKLLVDGVGACTEFYLLAKDLINAGVAVKIYHPLPWHLEQWPLALSKHKGINKFFYLLTFINKRDHRKLLLVDKNAAWLGSFNVSQKHLPRSDDGESWRDTAIEIRDTDLEVLDINFNAAWLKQRKRKISSPLPPSPFRFNYTRALRVKQREDLLKRIKQAKDTIWITNAYFIPDKHLLDALVLASRKGVDVQIILPRNSDIFFIPWASSYFYDRLVKSGVRIFEFQDRVLHAKTLIIDDWALIGSSNLNRRSLHHDLELDYSLQKAESKKRLRDDFLNDQKNCKELDLKEFEQTRLWQRVIGGLLIFLLARWV